MEREWQVHDNSQGWSQPRLQQCPAVSNKSLHFRIKGFGHEIRMDEKRRHYGESLSSEITDSIIVEMSDPPNIMPAFCPNPRLRFCSSSHGAVLTVVQL